MIRMRHALSGAFTTVVDRILAAIFSRLVLLLSSSRRQELAYTIPVGHQHQDEGGLS